MNNLSRFSKKQRLPSNTDLPASLSSFRVVIVGEGSGSGWPVTQDFLYGSGTAMSPGLISLIVQAIFTVLAFWKNWWGTVGVAGLTISGLLGGIFALSEPIVKQIFSPATFDPWKAVIGTGIIVVPFVMMILGIFEWSRRRRER